MLDDSQNAHSNAGSHFSGALLQKPGISGFNPNNLGMTGGASHADFDRGEDVNLDDVHAYGNEEPMGRQGDAVDSDEDEGSLYMPTLIQKRVPQTKPKKKSTGPPAPIPKP